MASGGFGPDGFGGTALAESETESKAPNSTRLAASVFLNMRYLLGFSLDWRHDGRRLYCGSNGYRDANAPQNNNSRDNFTKITGHPIEDQDAPWGHSKGMLALDATGNGFVMQVSTPD